MSDTEDADIAVVEAAYRAYAAGDIYEAVRHLHPNVEWIEPDEFPNGGRRFGPTQVFDYLHASYSSWRELHSTPTVTRRGDRIVAIHHVEGVMNDGTRHEMTVADVFTLRDGQVVHMQAYADPADVPD